MCGVKKKKKRKKKKKKRKKKEKKKKKKKEKKKKKKKKKKEKKKEKIELIVKTFYCPISKKKCHDLFFNASSFAKNWCHIAPLLPITATSL